MWLEYLSVGEMYPDTHWMVWHTATMVPSEGDPDEGYYWPGLDFALCMN